nr:hypothetical protein [Tanacetum cinerariifolium]
MSHNSATNTLDNEDTPLSLSIIVEDDETPQILTSSKEPITNELITPASNENVDESVQEDVAELYENDFYHPLHTDVLEEAESS